MRIVAGDIGGTKTLLSLVELRDGAPHELFRRRFTSADFDGLETLVETFLGGQRVGAAAFAVAGPVRGGRCKTTNLPWLIEEVALSELLGAPVALLNDFAAVVLGVGELATADLCPLNTGVVEPNGVIAVVGAGTGLGEAIGVPTETGLRALPTEGGHAHFAPRDDFEQRLLAFTRRRLSGRVSVERLVSGPGLHTIYEFVLEEGLCSERADTRARMQHEDPSAVIAELGRGADPACTLALSRFLSLYGAEAGDFALKVLPTGGLYIGGGIAPKLLDALRDGPFLEAFVDKGRMADLLATLPVAIITNPSVGLLGARARACMMV